MSYQLFRVGKVWHYRFQIDGARVQKSTRETIKREADLVASKAYERAKLWSRGGESVPTLRELVSLWLGTHQPTVSAAHFKVVETFGRLHLYDLADVEICDLTTEMVERSRLLYLETHAPASANQWLNVLRLLCRWAIRRKMIPSLPWSVKLLKVQKRPRAILPVPVATKWLAAVDECAGVCGPVAIAVRLMLGIGLREVETTTARWEWMDWDRRTYTPGITKGREADPVPVPDWLCAYLLPLRQVSGLIVHRPDGTACAPGFTRKIMLAANATCGIGHVTAHRLRGTFATLLSEQGAPIHMVKQALRHKNITTTMAYLEMNMDLVSRAQQRIATITGLDAETAKHSGEKTASDMPKTRMEYGRSD
ncbi:site-specific integrase [Paraburkholderia sp. WP4_3_2]|uniref:tyrosine-type recombinase/integrase n=1 Tax=Paraburkholderia sp. WP4_3_2 TaxID=2587162 RepID=UPI0016141BBF|nr:site-specific integrase [Paraburkholderia sp. WP4_3_2]MBB3256879.1 integrase [Paraburkholderia sp. WP4_3_2]